jgi:two-component system chemotaxis response regulator CheY
MPKGASGSNERGTQMNRLRALVVDDSRVMRNILIQLLRCSGLAEFEFLEAADGKEALDVFHPKHVDMLFVDWVMPRLTGVELVQQVRRMPGAAEIPIVMVTVERSMGKIEDALDEAGADAFVTKPFTAETLRKQLGGLVERALERKRAGHETSGGPRILSLFRGGAPAREDAAGHSTESGPR